MSLTMNLLTFDWNARMKTSPGIINDARMGADGRKKGVTIILKPAIEARKDVNDQGFEWGGLK